MTNQDLVAADSTREYAARYFERQLVALDLGRAQIEAQALPELEQSLERIEQCIDHPESFGTLKLRMTASAMLIVSTESHFEIGALPILLERKRFILERICLLRSEQRLVDLREVVGESSDQSIRAEFEKQIAELHVELVSSQEKARKVDQAAADARFQEEMELARVSAEIFERRSRVWRSFLERESVATIVGGFLLIGLTITMIVASFTRITISEILSNAFLVILGYFFGQAVGKADRRE